MIWLVPTTQVSNVWPDVEHLLGLVTDRPSCRHTLAGALSELLSGHMQLWACTQNGTIVAAATTKVVSYTAGDWMCVVLCGGRDIDDWGKEGITAIEEWASKCGCLGVEIIGRTGWAPKLGYERVATVAQRRL